jgi:predicted component of type VI protein secretion system
MSASAAAAFAVPNAATRVEPLSGLNAQQAAEAAANEAVSPFIALIKMMMGAMNGDNGDPTTVAELAERAPRNVSMVIDGVERAGLHTAIADPNFQATIFAPTNWVS